MDDYEAYTGDLIEDSFVVRDGSGKSFLYTVLLDGYLHGVILEKSDVNALKSVLLKGALATKNGKSSAYIKGRISNARTNNRRNASADVGTYSANGDIGYGRVGGRTPESVTEGNNSRKDSFNQTVRTVNNRLSLEHGKKDVEVSSTDEQQVRRGIISSEQAPANRGSGTNRQRRNGPSVKTQIKQLRSEIRELEDRRDFAYDKIEKRSIQEEIDEREYRIRQLREEGKNQPQRSDRIKEDSTIPADITEEMRQRGEKAIEAATAQREAKVAAEQKTHRAIRAALTNRDLIPQIHDKCGEFMDKDTLIQQWKAEEIAYIAESCFR